MPRIIVTTEPSLLHADVPLLLDEQVHSVHLSTGHASAQLIERLAWAVSDAEAAERAHPQRSARALPRSRGATIGPRPGARPPLGA